MSDLSVKFDWYFYFLRKKFYFVLVVSQRLKNCLIVSCDKRLKNLII